MYLTNPINRGLLFFADDEQIRRGALFGTNDFVLQLKQDGSLPTPDDHVDVDGWVALTDFIVKRELNDVYKVRILTTRALLIREKDMKVMKFIMPSDLYLRMYITAHEIHLLPADESVAAYLYRPSENLSIYIPEDKLIIPPLGAIPKVPGGMLSVIKKSVSVCKNNDASFGEQQINVYGTHFRYLERSASSEKKTSLALEKVYSVPYRDIAIEMMENHRIVVHNGSHEVLSLAYDPKTCTVSASTACVTLDGRYGRGSEHEKLFDSINVTTLTGPLTDICHATILSQTDGECVYFFGGKLDSKLRLIKEFDGGFCPKMITKRGHTLWGMRWLSEQNDVAVNDLVLLISPVGSPSQYLVINETTVGHRFDLILGTLDDDRVCRLSDVLDRDDDIRTSLPSSPKTSVPGTGSSVNQRTRYVVFMGALVAYFVSEGVARSIMNTIRNIPERMIFSTVGEKKNEIS